MYIGSVLQLASEPTVAKGLTDAAVIQSNTSQHIPNAERCFVLLWTLCFLYRPVMLVVRNQLSNRRRLCRSGLVVHHQGSYLIDDDLFQLSCTQFIGTLGPFYIGGLSRHFPLAFVIRKL